MRAGGISKENSKGTSEKTTETTFGMESLGWAGKEKMADVPPWRPLLPRIHLP